MSDREKAFFLYGVGVGMKCHNRCDHAFEMIADWFLPGEPFFALMEQAKAEVDPVFKRNGAIMIHGLDFPDDTAR